MLSCARIIKKGEGNRPDEALPTCERQGGKAGDDEVTMAIHIPAEIRLLLASKRQEEETDACLERVRARAVAREQAMIRKEAIKLARPIIAWAREFAAADNLPQAGVEIFACGRRSRTTVRVMPDGALVVLHIFLPYGGGKVVARRAKDLAGARLDVLRELAARIEVGAVWAHIRQTMAPG